MTLRAKHLILIAVGLFSLASMFLWIKHENGMGNQHGQYMEYLRQQYELRRARFIEYFPVGNHTATIADAAPPPQKDVASINRPVIAKPSISVDENPSVPLNNKPSPHIVPQKPAVETKGTLMCNGEKVDSEVIYWKIVPGDSEYESPITPHHENHHDRYLTFEYDHGGWNNIRMGVECLIVVAHAMGRTLVVPPQEHLYLLHKKHTDEEGNVKNQMGFADFFDLDLLKSHSGFHMMTNEEFLASEGVTGGLHGKLPPGNRTDIWGNELRNYLREVADVTPRWSGQFLAMPDSRGDFHMGNMSKYYSPEVIARMQRFGGHRQPFFYTKDLQNAHHIHVPGHEGHRILQHHYAFTFFVDKEMQSFYRRFVRDYMRYKDEIQCAGAEIVAAVREDALKLHPEGGGIYYALHIRRGDFQFKEVKLGASEIMQNLQQDGVPLIPAGALVYLSTDDPKGICENCLVQRIPCDKYPTPKPKGCPEDPSWDAFRNASWQLRFLDDYIKRGHLQGVNPNVFGMVESIVCSRAKIFAGTYFSTFTGYIHRLRGYHGLGEDTYYHSTGHVHKLRSGPSVGFGFSREWRAGWTDDGGELI